MIRMQSLDPATQRKIEQSIKSQATTRLHVMDGPNATLRRVAATTKKARAVSEGEEAFAAQIKSFEGWTREWRFARTVGRMWRFDFAHREQKLAVEIDGGVWIKGRHARGAGFEADCEKLAEAILLGWRVLRFTPRQVKSGYALDCVRRALK